MTKEWEYTQVLYDPNGKSVPEEVAEELFNLMIKWTNKKGLAIGGGMVALDECGEKNE